MDPARRLPLMPAVAALAVVVALEIAARRLLPGDGPLGMVALGFLRASEGIGLLGWVSRSRPGLGAIGLARDCLAPGLRSGLVLAALFGAVAMGVGGILYAGFDMDPVLWVQVKMPAEPFAAVIYLLVAGVVCPMTEEVVFRGILYNLLRPPGAAAAIAGSTLLFAAAHSSSGLPLIPAIGGLVFAAAMEKSRSLAAPMVIHVLGNLSLYGLSLF